jgi:hypothetical protein
MGLYPLVYGDEFLFLFYIMVYISLQLAVSLHDMIPWKIMMLISVCLAYVLKGIVGYLEIYSMWLKNQILIVLLVFSKVNYHTLKYIINVNVTLWELLALWIVTLLKLQQRLLSYYILEMTYNIVLAILD